jgi:sensor histidine kinase YesM
MNILLTISFLLSFLVNVLLAWYSKKLTSQFIFFSDTITSLENDLQEFSTHITGVHELETFYGDDTLGRLMQHSRELINSISEFNDSFSFEELEQPEEEEVDGGT